MYSVVELCLLCLTESENLKSILAQDIDGIVIEEKCTNFLNELVNINPEISYKICLHCLKNLNYVYNFKQICSQNIIKLNNYVNTLRNLHWPDKHTIKVTLKENELTWEIDKYDDTTRIETVKSSSQTQTDSLQSINIIVKNEVEENLSSNEIFPPIEVVPVKEKIADNCEVHEKIVSEKEEAMNVDENNYEREIIKEELKYIRNDSDIECDPFSLDDGTEEKSRISEPTNTYLVMPLLCISKNKCYQQHNATNTSSTDGSKNDKLKNERRFKCNHCPKAFLDKRHLKNHSRVHTGERPFKCTTCQKTFKQLVALNRHNRSHTGERPYACDVCVKAFADKKDLNRHKQIHNNVRPFKCSLCNTTFNQNVHLTSHMRKHTRDKSFQCTFCERKFTTGTQLKRHMRKHTGEKPYSCEYCQRAFFEPCNLGRHIRTKHNDKEETVT